MQLIPTLAAFLLSMVAPLVGRTLVALGIGTITYTGLSALLTSLLNQSKSSMQGMAPDVASIVAMAGGFEAMSIHAGAMVTALTFAVAKKFVAKATG